MTANLSVGTVPSLPVNNLIPAITWQSCVAALAGFILLAAIITLVRARAARRYSSKLRSDLQTVESALHVELHYTIPWDTDSILLRFAVVCYEFGLAADGHADTMVINREPRTIKDDTACRAYRELRLEAERRGLRLPGPKQLRDGLA